MPTPAPRRLATIESVVLALAAMLGSGVFAVFAPAARVAGVWLLLAVLLAGALTWVNAHAVGTLARPGGGMGSGYPRCRLWLAPWGGRPAGALLLVGQAASAAAAARVFANYVLPGHPLCVAVPLILVVAGLSAAGVRPTGRGTWVLASGVLAVLAVVVLVGLATRPQPPGLAIGSVAASPPASVGPFGVLASAGLVYFAFLGFPSSAPAGRRDREPAVLPCRVAWITLTIAVLGYLAVAGALLHALGLGGLVDSMAPLASAVDAEPSLGVLVRIGAAAATGSVLLAMLIGASRTGVAMARRRDLPHWLRARSSRGGAWPADGAAALASVLIAVLVGPSRAMALAAACMLLYFALVNAAVLRLPPGRGATAVYAALGAAGSLLLASALPRGQLLAALGIVVLALLSRTARQGSPAAGALAGQPTPPAPRSRCGRRRAGHR